MYHRGTAYGPYTYSSTVVFRYIYLRTAVPIIRYRVPTTPRARVHTKFSIGDLYTLYRIPRYVI